MPLYEYECDACGHRFEAIQKFSDPPLTTCPKCGGTVRKLIASPAFQFKGTGWYITDYAKKDGGGGKPTGSESSGDKGEAKTEKKADSPKSESSSCTPADSGSKPAAKD